jgi:GT2 family glycosyltransferase
MLLNPDTVLAPGALDTLRAHGGVEPGWAAWQALVMLPGGDAINTSGGVVHFLGVGWAGLCGEPAARAPERPAEVGFASGAAMVVRRAAWEAAGGFDERYFMYGEDLDLSLRLRLAGLRVGVVPAARVTHHYEFSRHDRKWFLLERNRWWTILSTYPRPLLLLLAPALAAAEIALLAVAVRGGWLRAKLRANVSVLRELGQILERRRAVQRTRVIGADDFANALSADVESPYLGPMARQPALVAAQRAYWRAVRGLLAALPSRAE